jgi:hypothetical protein
VEIKKIVIWVVLELWDFFMNDDDDEGNDVIGGDCLYDKVQHGNWRWQIFKHLMACMLIAE